MIDIICELMILFCGVTATYLLNKKNKKSKYGPIFGLCSQPFWLFITFKNNQWGMFLLSTVYVYIWILGIKSFWFKTKKRR